MENWEFAYDKWKTTPPDPVDSKFKCDCCGDEFYPGDRVYNIDGENFCYSCATNWLDDRYRFASEEECYGN